MLSYEHIYHAGNHADILKHAVYTLILQHLKKKPAPFSVIDTHAGSGFYALTDERALKTAEAESGIQRLLSCLEDESFCKTYEKALELLKPYLDLCRQYKKSGLYAGSPEIARCQLRAGDELILTELHPQAVSSLKANMKGKPLICDESWKTSEREGFLKPHIHTRSGFELLSSMHPPKRGLVLVDPSYEELSDFDDTAQTLSLLNERWKGGILAVWYPITTSKELPCNRMKQTLISTMQSRAQEERVLDIQLTVRNPESLEGKAALYGSGMLIINFPYLLDTQAEKIMPMISEALSPGQGSASIRRY